MATINSKIEFEHLGIGTVIGRQHLVVPINQRDYAWENRHVLALFQDFTDAIRKRRSSYFLGTIVLTGAKDDLPEIADGQQRLATTSILFAAIRDYFVERGEEALASSIENDFLFKFMREARENNPRIRLNIVDNEFYRKRVMSRPDSIDRKIVASKESHRKIESAAKLAAQHIKEELKPLAETNRISHLNEWLRFLESTAQVIVLKVPDDLDAFIMFETLNDRGLKTSQIDLLKNHLFKEAGDQIEEAHQKWSAMLAILESTDDDDIGLTYLRHLLISIYGPTKEVEVFETIKAKIAGKGPTLAFLDSLATTANDYTALFNSEHPKWTDYHSSVALAVSTMNLLRVVPIRPLMLAVVQRFERHEVAKAFRAFVNWSVRFLIVGGNRTGLLDKAYSECAHLIGDKIKTAKDLELQLIEKIPSDASFEADFATASVSKSTFARYYLRAIERGYESNPEPEFVPNDEPVINLEHVLPQNPDPKEWPGIENEKAAANYQRLGNLVLLQYSMNSALGNCGFTRKKIEYAKSTYTTTKAVAEASDWGPTEIDDRQRKLAKLAVKIWPITIK